MKAMQVMSALSQPTRFAIFTRLLAVSPEGLAAGELASALKVAPTAMSPHLAILSRAGLLKSTKRGRNILYRAASTPIAELVEFLSNLSEPIGDG